MQREIEKVIGYPLTTPTGAATTKGTITQDKSDGKVFGISINASYADTVLSLMYLTLSQGGNMPFENVPLSQFKPINGQLFYPLPSSSKKGGFFEEGGIDYEIQSVSATPVAATPIVLILHCVGVS